MPTLLPQEWTAHWTQNLLSVNFFLLYLPTQWMFSLPDIPAPFHWLFTHSLVHSFTHSFIHSLNIHLVNAYCRDVAINNTFFSLQETHSLVPEKDGQKLLNWHGSIVIKTPPNHTHPSRLIQIFPPPKSLPLSQIIFFSSYIKTHWYSGVKIHISSQELIVHIFSVFRDFT